MKIYLNSAYSIVKIEDSKFVANSAGFNNLIQYFFVNDNGEVYQNTEPSYVGLAFRKADGNKIFERRAAIANVAEGYCWQYTTAENDGVLSVKGALEISAQFVKTTLVSGEIASRDIQGVAVVTAYVTDNIGQADEDWYAANSANNQAQHDALQSQITTNTNDLTPVKTQVATNTANIVINTSEIEDNNQDISSLDTRVTTLENNIVYPETPIGQLTGLTLPTNAELTAFVVSKVSRQPHYNDTVIFILTVVGGTNKNYKYIYSADGWHGYELPLIENADNGTLGIVSGTYGIGDTANTLVSIIAGKILAIYIKTTNETYVDIRTLINTTYDTQINILAGTQNVGQALTAIADQLGNVINTYYLSVDAGATKQYVKDYALPKSFANVYYYQADGMGGLEFSDDIPTTPISGIQMTFAGTEAAEQSITSITRTLQYDYVFSKNNTYNSKFYIASSVSATVKFKLVTIVLDNQTPAETIATLDTALTDYITLTADEITAVDFQSNFNSLGGLEANCPAGSRYWQILYIVKDGTFAEAPTLTIYCNSTYPSTFNLNATSVVQIVNYIGAPKEVIIEPSAWVYNSSSDMWEAEIAPTTHEQPVGYRYIIDFYEVVSATSRKLIDAYPIIADDATITIYAQSQPTSNIVMIIASSVSSEEKGILLLINPISLSPINYETYGTIKITQNETATELTLPAPTDTSKSYRIFIVNSNESTENININGEIVEAGNGIQFIWAGQWYRGETLVNVSEVFDDRKAQLLSATLNDIDTAIAALTTTSIVTEDISTVITTNTASTLWILDKSMSSGQSFIKALPDNTTGTLKGKNIYIFLKANTTNTIQVNDSAGSKLILAKGSEMLHFIGTDNNFAYVGVNDKLTINTIPDILNVTINKATVTNNGNGSVSIDIDGLNWVNNTVSSTTATLAVTKNIRTSFTAALTSLTLTNSLTTIGDEAQIIFTAGQSMAITATGFTFSGDNVVNSMLTPFAGAKYYIVFVYLGNGIIGKVSRY